jgi:hypothetical protein
MIEVDVYEMAYIPTLSTIRVDAMFRCHVTYCLLPWHEFASIVCALRDGDLAGRRGSNLGLRFFEHNSQDSFGHCCFDGIQIHPVR